MKRRRSVLLVLGVFLVIGVLWGARFVGTATLFSMACEQNNKPLMQFALALGADIERRENGRTALLSAVESNRTSTVAHLLELGANPNGAYPDGVTALESARGEGFSQIVALLKRYGARDKP